MRAFSFLYFRGFVVSQEVDDGDWICSAMTICGRFFGMAVCFHKVCPAFLIFLVAIV